ncbi:Pyridoxamine 5'-phosphate oxidase domain-containing protein [Spironucleus salmonicida]|uniref:Pyridoxamine 5'-phosphate oxidase domain-containing protein n=1 Tax=Spironucleus salmonicida TaxID=348837 RepID=V6LL84_9EUKA|nr:Pyridoxamine 5'-phosphate oxidase domain-containing protein [Spironucleus salmonicida]|eukprot:EST45395.1 Pyridoxamine 5'-phosphate oxidase domain-containing protein [Spironucleus salmonicida]
MELFQQIQQINKQNQKQGIIVTNSGDGFPHLSPAVVHFSEARNRFVSTVGVKSEIRKNLITSQKGSLCIGDQFALPKASLAGTFEVLSFSKAAAAEFELTNTAEVQKQFPNQEDRVVLVMETHHISINRTGMLEQIDV